jgi:hypothetical protein
MCSASGSTRSALSVLVDITTLEYLIGRLALLPTSTLLTPVGKLTEFCGFGGYPLFCDAELNEQHKYGGTISTEVRGTKVPPRWHIRAICGSRRAAHTKGCE